MIDVVFGIIWFLGFFVFGAILLIGLVYGIIGIFSGIYGFYLDCKQFYITGSAENTVKDRG